MLLPDYVYVIGHQNGPVKVGVSSNPRVRLAALQTSSPAKLTLFYQLVVHTREQALEYENNFHLVHADKRLSGEWFDIEPDLAIESLQSSAEFDWHFLNEILAEHAFPVAPPPRKVIELALKMGGHQE